MKINLRLALSTTALAATVAFSGALAYAQSPQGDHGYYRNDNIYRQNQNPGYQQGVRDGSTDGRNDRAAGRPLKYGPGYNHPDRGYQDSFGDKKAYEQQYRAGYQQAYQESYNGRGPGNSHHNNGAYNNGSYNNGAYGNGGPGYGNRNNPGYEQGVRDGSTDGRNDRAAGRPLKYGPGYNHPDRGYQDSYGDKKAYEQQYRDGYQQAYQQSYNGRH